MVEIHGSTGPAAQSYAYSRGVTPRDPSKGEAALGPPLSAGSQPELKPQQNFQNRVSAFSLCPRDSKAPESGLNQQHRRPTPGLLQTPSRPRQRHSEGGWSTKALLPQEHSVPQASWAPSSCHQICCVPRRGQIISSKALLCDDSKKNHGKKTRLLKKQMLWGS